MSIDNAVGTGLNKIQTGIEKGKNKIESIKDISKLNKTIEEVSLNKAKAILELGEYIYFEVRKGNIKNEDILQKCNSIKGFDYIIYENKKYIEILNKQSESLKCNCGNEVSENDKFCGKCGSKVEIPTFSEDIKVCDFCEMEIDLDSNFCPCCGNKLV